MAAAVAEEQARQLQLRNTTGVPVILCSAKLAKRVLALLRKSGMHPQKHSRTILDRSPSEIARSQRAYQVSDEGARVLDRGVAAVAGEATRHSGGEQEAARAKLMKLLREGAIDYRPSFQLGEVIANGPICAGPIRLLKAEGRSAGAGGGQTGAAEGAFTFVELFAGIGGFRVGLEEAGGRCVLASEVGLWATKIYSANFGPSSLVGNIQHIQPQQVPPHDLLTAGFPCQPFTAKGGAPGSSSGGERRPRPRGFRDPRGLLFWHVMRLVRASRPRAVLLENVPGLINTDVTRLEQESKGGAEEGRSRSLGTAWARGSGLPCVLAALSAAGYRCAYRRYDAQQVVPQARERVFIVAIREDVTDAFTFPELPGPASSGAGGGPPKIRDVLEPTTPALRERYRLTTKQWAVVSSSAYYQKHPERRVPNLDGVANTLRSSYLSGYKLFSQFVRCAQAEEDGEEGGGPAVPCRFFTPREAARLQGFPDSYKLPGVEEGVPEVALYHALGNAVCPPVVRCIGAAIVSAIDGVG